MQASARNILDCLGPDVYHLRSTCRLYRQADFDLLREVLRWRCVNSPQRLEMTILHPQCLISLGKLPLRCASCTMKRKTRHMYRYYNKGPGAPTTEYLCCYCAYADLQKWLKGGGVRFQICGSTARMRCLLELHARIDISNKRMKTLFEATAATFRKR